MLPTSGPLTGMERANTIDPLLRSRRVHFFNSHFRNDALSIRAIRQGSNHRHDGRTLPCKCSHERTRDVGEKSRHGHNSGRGGRSFGCGALRGRNTHARSCVRRIKAPSSPQSKASRAVVGRHDQKGGTDVVASFAATSQVTHVCFQRVYTIVCAPSCDDMWTKKTLLCHVCKYTFPPLTNSRLP